MSKLKDMLQEKFAKIFEGCGCEKEVEKPATRGQRDDVGLYEDGEVPPVEESDELYRKKHAHIRESDKQWGAKKIDNKYKWIVCEKCGGYKKKH